ncbi:Putative aldolase-type TIM barrel, tRNA-dihydrouridine synthase, DUS-like, FMN-binding protein [Septoria linicola]|uniref:tRNA-dihydrouridine(16/17) synthase [NAD(P)(+)] n=1 Tax=Septoria linicola TaxID=215465 RepID=A0A9Q9AKU7_9PEZI|nr:putative aldolase-type TIM barrel, tRNA-dihydrouridine synthase, DUS-like, FMN-binding protein [Septoria linicola]USW49809.1 Putative aldolase-type TIM barrel, tRNA-dihydrouridine synthase, DUS-like, FMN-binding protein [Septoria linicola]
MTSAPAKLHGRAFYESIGSPKYVVAPMVDQSEFAWRLLTRSFLPPELRSSILAYTPMFHAKLFSDNPKYRSNHFEPLKPPITMAHPPDAEHLKTLSEDDKYLDGNPKTDRPLFVQFCANDPDVFLKSGQMVAPYCDAVDLNLGCPQGIAKRGNYGAFLQEDWDTIYNLINNLHKNLDVPVTAKFRIQETREKTLEYAKMILSAGASIITVHGRQRHQKGHETGLADWAMIRYLREQLPKDTVMFANGNILQYGDVDKCLEATGADAVMSAEGNLYDPSIFAQGPPAGEEGREYWRGRDGKGGYRADAVLRRYLDIIHKYVLNQEPPQREELFLPSDAQPDEPAVSSTTLKRSAEDSAPGQAPTKKQKREAAKEKKKKNGAKPEKCTNANLTAMQPHCFHILRSLVSSHHDVRDALARCRAGDIDAYENVLKLTQMAVKEGLLAYEKDPAQFETPSVTDDEGADPELSSTAAVRRCKRPFWVCQPYVRPLPKEALEKGSLQLSKKDKARLAAEQAEKEKAGVSGDGHVGVVMTTKVKNATNGSETENGPAANEHISTNGGAASVDIGNSTHTADGTEERTEIPKEGMVSG